MAVAVRIARAKTGREKIAFCGYHGWHDWYLAANLCHGDTLDSHLLPGLEPNGVPRSLAGTAVPFHYNRVDELERIIAVNEKDLAAIIMEPIRSDKPEPGFLESVRELATSTGAVLIFDEVTSGWRLNSGGVHLLYKVTPDIAVFAKAISNGYPMAALVGTSSVMQAAQDTFISSTYWTERIGPTAALATIHKHRAQGVSNRLIELGNRIQAGWRETADHAGLAMTITGISPLSRFTFELTKSQAVRTLFTQMMLDRGFLATNSFYAMFAHEDRQVSDYLAAIGEIFPALARAIERQEVERLLRGPVAHTGFYRLA